MNYFIVSDNNCQSTPISIHSSYLINSQRVNKKGTVYMHDCTDDYPLKHSVRDTL